MGGSGGRLPQRLDMSPGERNAVQNTFRAPGGGALGSPTADRGGAQGKNRRSEPLAPWLCMAGFQGAECISHIPLKKIYLFTLAFSMASWLFGSESVLAPQGFRGAAGEGGAPDRTVKSCDLWLLHLRDGGGAGAQVGSRWSPRWGSGGILDPCFRRSRIGDTGSPGILWFDVSASGSGICVEVKSHCIRFIPQRPREGSHPFGTVITGGRWCGKGAGSLLGLAPPGREHPCSLTGERRPRRRGSEAV